MVAAVYYRPGLVLAGGSIASIESHRTSACSAWGLPKLKAATCFSSSLGIGGGACWQRVFSGRDVGWESCRWARSVWSSRRFLLHAAPVSLPAVLTVILLFGVSAGIFSLANFHPTAGQGGDARRSAGRLQFHQLIGILIASALTFLSAAPAFRSTRFQHTGSDDPAGDVVQLPVSARFSVAIRCMV